MPAHDVDELRVALRRPHRGGLTGGGEQETASHSLKPRPSALPMYRSGLQPHAVPHRAGSAGQRAMYRT